MEIEARALDNTVARNVTLANAQLVPSVARGGNDYLEEYTHRPSSPWQEQKKTVPACRLLHTAWVLCWDYGFVFTGGELLFIKGTVHTYWSAWIIRQAIFILLACTSQLELYVTGEGGLLGELRKKVRRVSASRKQFGFKTTRRNVG